MALKRKQDNSPSGLGAELTQASTVYNERVSKAASDLAAKKASVVERGTARIADLRALEDEARTERLLVEEVVKQA